MPELYFPFKRMAIGDLVEFYGIGKIMLFNEYKLNPESSTGSLLKMYEDVFYNRLISFENELLQTIETTPKHVIDTYFAELEENIRFAIAINNIGNIEEEINQYNKRKLIEFEKSVIDSTNKYFQLENRIKYKHLEIYERVVPSGSLVSGFATDYYKTKITNYNFYCIEEKIEYLEQTLALEYLIYVNKLNKAFVDSAVYYLKLWKEKKIVIKAYSSGELPPIVFFEGILDIELVTKAAYLLGKEKLITHVAFRQRNGVAGLDKLYSTLTENNWETVPQKKILIYDCDVNKEQTNFGHVFKRVIPFQENHPIEKGIENLFPLGTIEKAKKDRIEFFDISSTEGTLRGNPFKKSVININKDEKRKFCDWIISNGTPEDFAFFSCVFELIEKCI